MRLCNRYLNFLIALFTGASADCTGKWIQRIERNGMWSHRRLFEMFWHMSQPILSASIGDWTGRESMYASIDFSKHYTVDE